MASESELMIYKNAVDNQMSKRDSSSSEEVGFFNSSDEIEMMEIDDDQDIDLLINQFIVEAREKNQQYHRPPSRLQQRGGGSNYVNDGQQPSTSRQPSQQPFQQRQRNQAITPEDKANEIIRDAEQSRARIHQIQGNQWDLLNVEQNPQYEIDLSNEFVHSAMVDENYHLVGSHIDSTTQQKIVKGEYVDFAKLVPRDRILSADDHRFEMIVKEGRTYWVPANDREGTNITSYSR